MPAGDETKVEDVGSKKDDGVAKDVVENGGSNAAEKKEDAARVEPPEADDFGLPVKPPRRRWDDEDDDDSEEFHEANSGEVVEAADADVEAGEGTVKETPEVPKAKESETSNEAESESENQRPRAATLDDIADREPVNQDSVANKRNSKGGSRPSTSQGRNRGNTVSEWSHQQLAPPLHVEEEEDKEGDEWQQMPAFATHRIYDDWGKVLAKEYDEQDDEQVGYGNLGGAGKGYTRVQIDDDAQSATSMDDNTAYLFKEPHASNALDEDEEGRDMASQMQTTKQLLTEGQRIAYVGLVRLSIGKMTEEMSLVVATKQTKKTIDFATEALKMWGQKMMVRVYSHMDISSAEQIMVEQLAEHGVLPSDLTPALMQNARVKNPTKVESEPSSSRPSVSSPTTSTSDEKSKSKSNLSTHETPTPTEEPPPAYEKHTADELTVQDPSQIENNKDLDLDIRWTVLCDLFLIFIADSTYDSRSRVLLEHVGAALSVNWQEVCRFEKRITDALEMQEQADKENWNEDEHLESRRKAARNRRLMVMGLCTVGGGIIIGLSAGALAPVIGAGLAAGFTGIGIGGTSTFLAGTGAAALIGSGGALTGGIIGVKASNRRTGAVKTFEYRPLFNNKRPNLIVTVSGWMTGKVDDVRLPFSTVNPVMGDIYSVHWEPEMLQSTGQTIQILATEALTQTIQQILAATTLSVLMAGLSLPIVLSKLAYFIDNPWSVSCARADATGLILADSLIDRNLGVRPITLVGFSLGARVIFSALKELARRGALGIVQNAYLFGSPIVANKDDYTRARTVVSGRFVNGYASNDWILGYLFRATSGGIMRVSGLASVDVRGVENIDFTELVPGHMAYRGMMPMLLEEVGWQLDGIEFSEIEDPDPENHEKRQRELIDEIEAARNELEEKQQEKEKKGGFKSFFSRKKAPKKKDWETYDERSQQGALEGTLDDKEAERIAAEKSDVMFDVEAIRAEALKLAIEGGNVDEIKAHLQIKEIESTMPALMLNGHGAGEGEIEIREIKSTMPALRLDASSVNGSESPSREGLRQTKSYDATMASSALDNTKDNAEKVDANGHLTPSRAEEKERPQTANPPSVSESTAERQETKADESQRPSPAPSPKPPAERPPLRSAATTPAPSAAAAKSPPPPEIKSPDHNPWSDEEEFGKEKEVQMSFE